MVAYAPPVHLLNCQGCLRGFAELDISNSLAFSLSVLVDLNTLHLQKKGFDAKQIHDTFQMHFFHLSKFAKRVSKIFLLHRLATNNEESRVWWNIVILLRVVHRNG